MQIEEDSVLQVLDRKYMLKIERSDNVSQYYGWQIVKMVENRDLKINTILKSEDDRLYRVKKDKLISITNERGNICTTVFSSISYNSLTYSTKKFEKVYESKEEYSNTKTAINKLNNHKVIESHETGNKYYLNTYSLYTKRPDSKKWEKVDCINSRELDCEWIIYMQGGF